MDMFDFGKCSDDLFGHWGDRMEAIWPSRLIMGPGDPGRFVVFPLGDPSETQFDGG
jgi:hypothetical protein